jgi:Ca2+-dependent lipid-binding protein
MPNCRETTIPCILNRYATCVIKTPGSPLPDCFAEIYVNDKVLRSRVVKATIDPCWNDSFRVQVQKNDTIRIAIFDQLRSKESEREFLGLVAFDAKDRNDLGGKEDKVVELKLTSPHKQAWYGANEVSGKLRFNLATKVEATKAETSSVVDRLSTALLGGMDVADLWR